MSIKHKILEKYNVIVCHISLDEFLNKVTAALKKRNFDLWGSSEGRCSEVTRAVKALAQTLGLEKVWMGSCYVRAENDRAHDFIVIDDTIYDWTFHQFFNRSKSKFNYPHVVKIGSPEFNKWYAEDFILNKHPINIHFQSGDDIFEYLKKEIGL